MMDRLVDRLMDRYWLHDYWLHWCHYRHHRCLRVYGRGRSIENRYDTNDSGQQSHDGCQQTNVFLHGKLPYNSGLVLVR